MEGSRHDRRGMATVRETLVSASLGPGSIVAMTRINASFFGADDEKGWVRLGERHGCGRQVLCFGRWRCGELEVFLGLGKHVNSPSADNAVCGRGQDIVRVLGAYD